MQKRQRDGTGEEKTVREPLAPLSTYLKFIFVMVMLLFFAFIFLKQAVSSPLSPLPLPLPLVYLSETQPHVNAAFISDD